MTHIKLWKGAGAAAFALVFTLLLQPATHGVARAETLAQDKLASAQTAEDDLARGRRLLEAGDAAGAVAALKAAAESRRTDADAWYYYGLALTRARKGKDARKAFERAVKLRPDWPEAHTGLAYALLTLDRDAEAEAAARRALDASPAQADAHYVLGVIHLREGDFDAAQAEAEEALRARAEFPAAAYLAGDALLNGYFEENDRQSRLYPISAGAGKDEIRVMLEKRQPALAPYRTRMSEAAGRLEAFAAARPQDPSAESWREQAQSLRLYGRWPNGGSIGPDIYTSSQVTTRALIVAKPEPGYTEEAREEHTSGAVRLRAVLGSDGHVRNIVAMRRLPNGLTEKAVEAARRIRFTPAKLNGQPVSQLVVLEYNFVAY